MDNSSFSALESINASKYLVFLFDIIIIPKSVEKEFLAKHTRLPSFIQVENLTANEVKECALMSQSLGEGEKEAIILAKRFHSPLLIDDQTARKEAEKQGVKTLGVCSMLKEGFIVCLFERDEFDDYRIKLTSFLYMTNWLEQWLESAEKE